MVISCSENSEECTSDDYVEISAKKREEKEGKINPIHLQSTTKEISEETSISVSFFSLILESLRNRYVHCYDLSVRTTSVYI